MTRRSPRKWNERLHSLYRWHRWLGVSASLFLIWLAVSGILINHASDLQLDARPVQSRAVVAQYGIHVDPPTISYAIGEHRVSEADGRLWWDASSLQEIPSPLLGAASLGRFWFAAGRDWLLLGNSEGEIIETLPQSALPHPVSSIGSIAERLCIRQDERQSCASLALDDWQPTDAPLQPALAGNTPPALAAAIAEQAHYRYVTWERLLRDLHSGRFFGSVGVLLIDAVAVIMIVLALSGLLLWLRYLARMRMRRRLSRKRPG